MVITLQVDSISSRRNYACPFLFFFFFLKIEEPSMAKPLCMSVSVVIFLLSVLFFKLITCKDLIVCA